MLDRMAPDYDDWFWPVEVFVYNDQLTTLRDAIVCWSRGPRQTFLPPATLQGVGKLRGEMTILPYSEFHRYAYVERTPTHEFNERAYIADENWPLHRSRPSGHHR